MRKNLGGVYDRLTPRERFQLFLEATARRDETEVERLAGTCPRYRSVSVRSDPAFAERLRASRQIAFSVFLVLMEISAKLMVITTCREYVTLLSRSLVTEAEGGYLKGWEAGCDHAWQSAGMAGPFPRRVDRDLELGKTTYEAVETHAREDENAAKGSDDDEELAAMAEALATEVSTLWEAFSRFCRAEMSTEPETVLLAWFPPILGWIQGALKAADGAGVDANVLLEYETSLTEAWRGFLREA